MLNEKLEADEYMLDLGSWKESVGRIYCRSFARNLSGLSRAMTMVARYFLFEDITPTEENLDDRILRTGAALRIWAGLVPRETKNEALVEKIKEMKMTNRKIDSWLPLYLTLSAERDGGITKEKAEQIKRILRGKLGAYSVSALFLGDAEDNDYSAIRFEKIIANALLAGGPLRRYYLVSSDTDWKKNVKKQSDKEGSSPKKINAKDEDRILKLISAYLLERNRKKRKFESITFEPVNYKVISFWVSIDLDGTDFKKYRYCGEKLFETQDKVVGSMSKCRPNEKWLEQCGWEIIDATDNDELLNEYLAEKPNTIFYSDNGHGKPLSKNVRYERLI